MTFLNIFSYIFSEIRHRHFMQIVSSADNLHELLKPIFWENTIFVSSAEFVQRVEKIIKQVINAKHAQSVLKVKKRPVLNDVPPFSSEGRSFLFLPVMRQS